MGVRSSRNRLRGHTKHQSIPGGDLFQFNDRDYIVIVDYLSNFREVDHLENTHT